MFSYRKATLNAVDRFKYQNWYYREDSNFFSMIEYINYLFGKRARLLVVRIDLSFQVGAPGQWNAEIARECFSRFMNNRRRNRIFEYEMGYIWSLEWAADRGFHYHCIFFFDGHLRNRDEPIGHFIGQYWRDAITQGTGYYHSCNDDKERLARQGYPIGMGMIHRDDCFMRENLAWMATYLLKEPEEGELPLHAVLPECLRGFRTFGHGGMKD